MTCVTFQNVVVLLFQNQCKELYITFPNSILGTCCNTILALILKNDLLSEWLEYTDIYM